MIPRNPRTDPQPGDKVLGLDGQLRSVTRREGNNLWCQDAGGKIGGKIAARKMTKAQRVARAQKASAAAARVRTKKAAAKKKSQMGALPTDTPYPFPAATPLRVPSGGRAKAKAKAKGEE